jgi:hypothetical protein
MKKLTAGVIFCFLLLAFVKKFSLFGQECFYVGSLRPDSLCINPAIYYGAWIVGLALAGWGGIEVFKEKTKQ